MQSRKTKAANNKRSKARFSAPLENENAENANKTNDEMKNNWFSGFRNCMGGE